MTRVTFNSISNALMRDINENSKKYNQIQESLATGKTINTSSDDPLGTNRSLVYRTAIAENNQFNKNVDDGTAMLSLTETTLNDISSVLRNAKTLLLQGANTPSNDNRSALAAQIKEIILQAVTSANKQYFGKYIFAGSNSQVPPFVVDNENSPGKVNYQGNNNSPEVRLGKELKLSPLLNGNYAFGFSGQKITSDVAIKNKDMALNVALGATPASSNFAITVGDNPAVNVNFLDTAYDSQQDLVDAINAKVFRRGTVDLSIPFPPVTRTSLLSALGVVNGTLTINNGTTNYTFDVDNTTTIAQFVDLIPQWVPGVNAYFETANNRIILTNKNSTTLTIADGGGGNFANVVGLDVATSNLTPALANAEIDKDGKTIIYTKVTTPNDRLALTDGVAGGLLSTLKIADNNGLVIGNLEDNKSLFDALVKARYALNDYAYQDNTLLNMYYGENSLGLQVNDIISLNVGGPAIMNYQVTSSSTGNDLAQNVQSALRGNGYATATVRFDNGALTVTNYSHPTLATANIPVINLTATDSTLTTNRTIFNNAFSGLAVPVPADNSSVSSYILTTDDFISNIQDAMGKIDTANSILDSRQTEAGGRLQHFETVAIRIKDTNLSLNTVLSNTEDADIAELAVKLKAQELILQTSLVAASKAIQPTLAQFL